MRIQFSFSGPFSQAREQLNAVAHNLADKPGSEQVVTRELVHHCAVDCVDVAQRKHAAALAGWKAAADVDKDAAGPAPAEPAVSGSVDCTVSFG